MVLIAFRLFTSIYHKYNDFFYLNISILLLNIFLKNGIKFVNKKFKIKFLGR